MTEIRLGDEVAAARAEGRPVVALESTVYSTLGLPHPANREALDRCVAAVRGGGAVPAVTAVLDGVATVGLSNAEHDRVLDVNRKVARRDLPLAVGQGWDVGVTTVSASVALAAAAGVEVFATGGIGGVHRDAEHTGDISADLPALAVYPVITVCAGAKVFLDLGRTLEYLETASVPVLGWQTAELPAFYTRSSGLAVPHRVDDADEVAAIWRARASGIPGGMLVCVPLPEAADLGREVVDAAIAEALTEAARDGLRGADVTPFVLARIAAATDGQSVPANIELVANNARVAAQIATAVV